MDGLNLDTNRLRAVKDRCSRRARKVHDPVGFPGYTKFKLWKYSQLGITDRSSHGKQLGDQRLDRRGNHELKNLSYHAWRIASKSTTGPNPIKSFYQASKARTSSVRHGRPNTQRQILKALWQIWLCRRPFDPGKFFPTDNAPNREAEQRPRRQAGGTSEPAK